MGEVDIQIKVLKQGTPVFFTWLNKDSNTTKGYLVSCPCQNLDLIDGSSLKVKKAKLSKGCIKISPINPAKALQIAEIVTLSKGVESKSSLGRENHHEKVERGREISREGDGENEVVDEYRFSGGALESNGGGSLQCGGGDLEDDGEVLEHDERGIECGDGGRLEDSGGLGGDGDAEDVGSMSSKDGSDIKTDQINREDVGEDRGREDLKRKFKVKAKSKDNSDNDGTHFEESIETSDLCKENETVNCEQTDDGTRQRGEVDIKDRESFCDDDIQQDKDLLQDGNKRDDMTVTQSDNCEQDENYEGNQLRDGSDVRPAGISERDSVTESDITPNIEEGGVAKIKGETDEHETGDDPVSDNIRTIPDSENGQMVTNSLQVQQRDLITHVMDISSLPAESVVVLDERNEVDSPLFKAIEGIMGAELSGNENEVSRCERLSEPSGCCGKTFQHKRSLKAHEKTHWEVPLPLPVQKPKNKTLDPKIRLPSDKTKSETNQQQGDPVVSRSKQVSCQICGKRVSCKSFRRHLRTVHKVTNLSGSRSRGKKSSQVTCATCGNTVSRKSIKRHQRIHSKTKSETNQQQGDPVVRRSKHVSCQICGKRMSCKSLCRHLRTVHKAINQAGKSHSKKSSNVICAMCEKIVSHKSIKRHLRIHWKSDLKSDG